MTKKWIVIAIALVVLYFVWRRFGGQVKETISSATA